MIEANSQLNNHSESRVDRTAAVIARLSDFEQDELRFRLQESHLQDFCQRLKERRNCMALAIHTLIFAGGFFGLFMGTFVGIMVGVKSGFMAGLSMFLATAVGSGVCFGVFMGLYLICLLRLLLPRFARNLAQLKSAAFRVNDLQVALPATEAFDVCLSTLSGKKGVSVEAIDKENGNARAFSAMSWRSPGEIVGFKVDPLAEDRSRVRVYSKCLFTGLDFGKNRINVEALSRLIADAVQVHLVLKLP